MRKLEAIYEKLQQIYEEREREYKLWEEDYQAKAEALSKKHESVIKIQAELDKRQKELEDRERSIIAKEQELSQKEEQFTQSYIELEMLRNESIKLRRKNQEINLNEAAENGESIQQTGHLEKLEKEIKALREERVELLKRNLELESVVKEVKSDIFTERNSEPEPEATEEELTAEELASAMKTEYQNVVCETTGEGTVVIGERLDIKYRFVFAEPPYFVLTTKAELVAKKNIDLMEQTYSGVQAIRSGEDMEVTTYFAPDLQTSELLEKVKNLSDYLKPE